MIKDDYQASINMCIALEIKYKIKLTGVIETLERAKKVEELMLIYKQYYHGYLSPADQKRRQELEKELREELNEST